MQGKVTVADHDSVRIHDYTSPQDGLFVHSVIIEGASRLVLFDCQFFLRYATEVADYIDGLKKPLDRIIISHIHPDHWSGLEVISKRFPQVPIFALQSVKTYIEVNGGKIMTARQGAFGDAVASHAVTPTHVLATGKTQIDGVTYEFEEFDEGESQYQLVARLPEQKTLMVFDLVFPKVTHVFTVAPHFDHWIEILETLKGKTFDNLVVGHAGPVGREDIDSTIAYLRETKVLYQNSKTPGDYATKVKARYPERQEPGWIDFSALLLYGVINP